MSKALKTRLAAVPALVLATVATAHAELPAEAGTAIADYKTDSLSAIALVMAAGVAVWALKRLASKMGWL